MTYTWQQGYESSGGVSRLSQDSLKLFAKLHIFGNRDMREVMVFHVLFKIP